MTGSTANLTIVINAENDATAQVQALSDSITDLSDSFLSLGESSDDYAANMATIDKETDGAIGGITILSDDANEASISLDKMAVSAAAAGGATQDAGAAADEGSAGFDLFSGSMLKSLAPLAALFVGFEGFKDLFEGVKTETNQMATSNALLTQGLKDTHDAVGLTVTQIDQMAEATTKNTDFTNAENTSIAGVLVTVNGMNKDTLPTAINLVDDMATKMAALKGQSVPSMQQTATAARAMAKALADPTAAAGAFTRAGLTLDAQQKEQIALWAANSTATNNQTLSIKGVTAAGAKALENWNSLTASQQSAAETADGITASQIAQAKAMGLTNVQSQSQQKLMSILSGYIGGDATSAAQTFAGEVDQLKNKLVLLGSQGLGKVEADVAALAPKLLDMAEKVVEYLKPAFDDVFSALGHLMKAFKDIEPVIKVVAEIVGVTLIVGFKVLLEVFATVINVIASVITLFDKHKAVTRDLAIVITTLVVPAIIAFGVQSVIAAAKSVAAFVASTATTIANFLALGISGDVTADELAASFGGGAIASAAAWVLTTATMIAEWAASAAKAVISAAMSAGAWVDSAQSTVYAWVESSAKTVAGWVATAASAAANAAVAAAAFIWGALTSSAAWIASAIASAAAWIASLSIMTLGIAALVAVVIAAVAWIITHWSTVKQWFSDFVSWLENIFKATITNIENAWNAITGFFSRLWSDIMSGVKTLVGFYVKIFTDEYNGVIAVWNAVIGFFNNIWSGIKAAVSTIVGFIKGIFQREYNGVIGIWQAVTGFFSSLIQDVINAITSAVSGFGTLLYNAGKDLINGLVNGVKDALHLVTDVGKDIGNTAVSAVKDVLSIFSPSRVFADLGTMIPAGFVQGIQSGNADVSNAGGAMAKSAITGASNVQVPASQPVVNNSSKSNSTVTNNFAAGSIVLSTVEAVTAFIDQLNIDSLAIGKGMAPTQGHS